MGKKERAIVPSDIGGCETTSTAIKSNHFKSYPFSPFSYLTYASQSYLSIKILPTPLVKQDLIIN